MKELHRKDVMTGNVIKSPKDLFQIGFGRKITQYLLLQ